MRLQRDQGVRARFVADDEMVLEQWIQFMGRFAIDSCRVELVPLAPGLGAPGYEPEPSAVGTALVCRFFAPRERRAAKVLIWLPTLALGLALAIGIL